MSGWTVDKKIPVAFLAFLLIQSVLAAIAWGRLVERVDHVERELGMVHKLVNDHNSYHLQRNYRGYQRDQ